MVDLASGQEGAAATAGATGEHRTGQLVSVLEQTLWRQLSEAATLDDYVAPWLALQCRGIDGAKRAVAVLGTPDVGPFTARASWPDGEACGSAVSGAIDLAISERRGVVQRLEPKRQSAAVPDAVVAYPLLADDQVHGAAAVEVEAAAGPQLGRLMRQLQWGVSGLRDRLRKERAEADRRALDRSGAILDLLAVTLEEPRFLAACRAAVTELTLRTGCERVSIGFRRRGHTAVSTISHSAKFGKRMNLVRMLGEAMDEAIDQRAVLLYPPGDGQELLATRAHGELAQVHGAGTILTVPLFVKDDFIGALTLERPSDRPFEQAAVDLVESAAAVLGPVLQDKRQNDRWVVVKLGESIAEQVKRLLGPLYLGRKLAALAAVAVAAFFTFAEAAYRVTADAEIEGLVQRAIVASFDGFIKDAPARAGDEVGQGQLLAALDDRELALERLHWVTERQQRVYEHDLALSARNRADLKIVKTQIAQAEAQIKLIDKQLARAKLRAPFDGLIVAGDLSQSIGASVRRGEILYEITPLEAYRVILQVDETQIAHVEVGQHGDLVAAALPHDSLPFVVDKITPVAQTKEGRSFFRVEARLSDASPRLRPGMKGIAKIEIGQRRLIWIWTRALRDWLRVATWQWLP